MKTLMDRSRMLAKLSASARKLPGEPTDWYRITDAAGENDDTAEVAIYAEIGWFGVTAQDFMAELRQITAPKINLRMSSPGGDLFDGIAIMNLLRAHTATVTAYVDSLAASIASVIVMGADKVVMQPFSQLMIHDASGGCWGNAAEMRDMADLLDKQSDNIASVYAERAGGQQRSWRNRMKDETWYTADEAVAAGLADEVAPTARRPTGSGDGGDPASNQFDLAIYSFAGLFRYAGRDYAPAPDLANRAGRRSRTRAAVVDTACPVHHPDTTDTTWDAGEQVGKIDSPMTLATAKAMYGWYDADQVDGGELPKSACSLPHHEVADDGTPGAANLAGVRNALSRLPQSDIPEDEQDAVREHLQAHLDDADTGSGDSSDDEDDDTQDRAGTGDLTASADDTDTTAGGLPAPPPPPPPDPPAPTAGDDDGADETEEQSTSDPEPEPAITGGDWDSAVAHLVQPSSGGDWVALVAHLTESRRPPTRRHRTQPEEATCPP